MKKKNHINITSEAIWASIKTNLNTNTNFKK